MHVVPEDCSPLALGRAGGNRRRRGAAAHLALQVESIREDTLTGFLKTDFFSVPRLFASLQTFWGRPGGEPGGRGQVWGSGARGVGGSES